MYEKGLGTSSYRNDLKLLEAHYEENKITFEFYYNVLIDELKSFRPKVLVAMGEMALRVLTGNEGITKWRGSTLTLSPELQHKLPGDWSHVKVVPCQHIAIEQVAEKEKYILALDIAKAVKISYRPPHYPIDDYHITIARCTNDYLQWRTQFPDNPEWMTTDVETHLGFMTCASYTFDGRSAVVIPMLGSKLNIEDRGRIGQYLNQDLANPKIAKNNQNIGYDWRQYFRYGYSVRNIKWDTMLAAHTLAPEFLKNLGFLISTNTTLNYHKDEGKEFDPAKHSFDQLYEYCAKDSLGTHRVMETQRNDLTEAGWLEFFETYVMRMFHTYYEMESVGILQDPDSKLILEGKYEGMLQLKTLELEGLTGLKINTNSPDQIGKYMEEQNFPIFRHRTDRGFMKPNTDVESIKKMLSKDAKEYAKCELTYGQATRFLDLVLLIRRIGKVLQYIRVGVHPDGRIRFAARLSATTSGRTANSKTGDISYAWVEDKNKFGLKPYKLGNSFQTVTKHGFIVKEDDGDDDFDDDIEDGIIGKDVRSMYVPDSGWVLVEGDRSQAEARVVDLMAEDYAALEEYGKVDKHCKTAALIFTQYTYEDIFRLSKVDKTDEGENMRHLGKKGSHAANYDMGDFRLASMANITKQLAKKILDAIHRGRPSIRQVFHKQVDEQVRKFRFMENPYGRPRMFYDKLDGHGIKVALSWYPQSVISDGTKLAVANINDRIDKMQARIVAENHDSITALVKRGYIRKYLSIAKTELEAPIDFRKGTFYRDYQMVIPSEWSIGRKNWEQMREVKLRGLRIPLGKVA